MTSAAAFRGKDDPGGGHGSVLREAITEAMRAKTDESPAIKSKMDDVAEAVAAVKRDLIGGLLVNPPDSDVGIDHDHRAASQSPSATPP
jgi:hypothetical protein